MHVLFIHSDTQQFHKVPLEKVFEFHQPVTEYSVHPQIVGTSEAENVDTVSEQPQAVHRVQPQPYESSTERPSSGGT